RSTLPRERIHVRLSPGVPGEQIVHQAQAADLIVMGTHGWSGIVRWMLGSVAHYVPQTAPCPVLTIAPASVSAPARPGAESHGAGRGSPCLTTTRFGRPRAPAARRPPRRRC